MWFCCRANDKNQCTCPACNVFIWTMHEPKGWVYCDVKKSKDKCTDFCQFACQQNYIGHSSFIHVIKETIIQCVYFEIRLSYQNNQKSSSLWIYHADAALIRVRLFTLHATTQHNLAQLYIVRYQWMIWNWFVPVLWQFSLATFAHTY